MGVVGPMARELPSVACTGSFDPPASRRKSGDDREQDLPAISWLFRRVNDPPAGLSLPKPPRCSTATEANKAYLPSFSKSSNVLLPQLRTP